MMILNEQEYVKNILLRNNNDIKSAVRKIGYIARYFKQILNYNDTESYTKIVDWMKNNCENFDECSYSNVISKAISKANKYQLYVIDSIDISSSELNKIKSLGNLREEKIAFVLLCMAKHQAYVNGFTNGLVKYSIVDVCKQARVVVPADEREYILYNLLKKGVISCPKKNDTECLMVNFIDNNDTELTLTEMDCQELAYSYLNWKNSGGYDRCNKCGRLMRHHKNRKYCIECSKYQPTGDKIISCIDCGKQIIIPGNVATKCRCDDCQKEHIREYDRERKRLRR